MRYMSTYFIAGIGTDVGKTIASSIVVEALEADYWKPIQAGDLHYSDTDKVKALISNSKSRFFDNAYGLKTPMSPHAAAEIDEILIDSEKILQPSTDRPLVIEGAGGLLVPINEQQTICDIIKPEYKILLVSRHYLGSINHTLLSISELKNRGFKVAGLIWSGDEVPSTESIITSMTDVPVIGRINEEEKFDPTVIRHYASKFKQQILSV